MNPSPNVEVDVKNGYMRRLPYLLMLVHLLVILANYLLL